MGDVMRLRELEIKNFGCVGNDSLKVVIDDIIVLIGPNNVGKTTILNAYEAFETGGPLTIERFHENDLTNTIEIAGIFSDISDDDKGLIGEKWLFTHEEYDTCIKYKYDWLRDGEKGQKYSWNENDKDWIKGGMGGWDSKIQSCIPTSLKVNPLDSSEVLEKNIIEILTNAIKESTKGEDSKIKGLIDSLNEIAEEIKGEIEEELSLTTSDVEDSIKDIFPNYKILLKPQAGKFEAEKIIAAGSHIRIKHGDGNEYPLEFQGAGLQRTFLWSAIKSLAEVGKYKKGKKEINGEKPKILLIEEPESFLHPPAIREVREALYKIAELENWQIMITTHSPIFIDVSKPHTTIIRIDKDSVEKTKIFSTDKANFTDDDKDRLKMVRACNPSVNEFFFSNKVLLVEGDTEQSIFNELKNKHGECRDLQIVNCYGKANIPTFQKILNHFKVNYIVMHDVDCPKSKRKGSWIRNAMWTMNEKIFNESKISEGCNNIIIANMPDFEMQFFGYLQKGDKPYSALKKITDLDFQKTADYQELEKIVKFEDMNENSRSIKNYSDYDRMLNEYIKMFSPEPKEQWYLD